jgi:hypothetical protein
MENTFENALAYINQLKEINPTALSDDKVLASAFMSYSAKTNIVDKNLLKSFAEKFRQWQRKWDLFDKQELSKKPPHLDEFIDSLISGGVSS